ncbi:MAG: DUF418 domain-containing protein [Verrucomicrobiota bacterium]
MNRAPGSLDPKQRYALMDGLRGLALLGILLVNLRIMGAPSMAYGEFSIWSGAFSEVALLVSALFLDGAFWTLFAMLFGAGFAVMMGEAPLRREAFVGQAGPPPLGIGLWAYYRRLVLIGLLGLLHVLLLWYGDILMIYVLAGLALPLFCKRRIGTLLVWAVVLIVVPQGIYLLLLSSLQLVGPEELAEILASYAKETRGWMTYLIEGYRSSDFGVIAWTRLNEFGYNFWYALTLVPTGLGVMLIGMVLARKERFRLDVVQGRFFRKLLLFAIVPAVAGKVAYAYGLWAIDFLNLVASAAFIVGYLVGGLASAFILLCSLRALYLWGAARGLRQGLEAAGRMALTLYLMQSLIGGLIFYGYGLGLYAAVPPQGLLLIGLVIFAGQVAFAHFWFMRYRHGPLEYMLRRFTYWGWS